MRKRVGTRQFLEGLIAVFEVDGSDVTTSYANTALDSGQHLATIKVGTGASDNVYTIKLNKALGLAPAVFVTPKTLDVTFRKGTVTSSLIPLTAIKRSNLAQDPTAAPDFTVMVFGTEHGREGSY